MEKAGRRPSTLSGNRRGMLPDDVLAAPVAPPEWQPATDAVPRFGPVRVMLQAQPSRRLVQRNRMIAIPTTLVIGLLVTSLPYIIPPHTIAQYRHSLDLTINLLMNAVFGIPVGLLFGYAFSVKHAPIVAQARYIQRFTGSSSSNNTFSWPEVRAWAVQPPTPGTDGPARYFVATASRVLTWEEPPNAKLAGRGVQGDRQAAYQARASELHALIFAKTGLPLRIIPPA